MKVTFKINYNTNWGEGLYVCGATPELGNDTYSKAIPMKYMGDGNWMADVEIQECKSISYRYYVLADDKRYWTEWGPNRENTLIKDEPHVFDDQWRSNGVDKTYFSGAFTEGLILHKPVNSSLKISKAKSCLVFEISAPNIQQIGRAHV